MKGKFPVIKYLFRKDFPVLGEALSGLSGEQLEAQTPKELTDILQKAEGGLVLFFLNDRKDLIEISSVIKSLRGTLKETPIKAVIVNFSTGKMLEEKALQIGVQDLISFSVSQKVLKFKLDFWLRALEALTRTESSHILGLVDFEQELTERKDVQWLNALHMEDDIWLLKSTADLKKTQNIWSAKIMGPGPLVGEWLEFESGHWSFQFRGPEKTRFLSGMGNWFLKSDTPPLFMNEEKKWLFQGENLELYYIQGKEKLIWMKSQGGEVTLRKNSPFVLVKEDLIKDSFNQETIKAWAKEDFPTEKFDSFLMINKEFFSCKFDDYFDHEAILQLNNAGLKELHGKGIFIGPLPRHGKQKLEGDVNSLEDGFVSLKLNQESVKIMENANEVFEELQTNLDDRLKRMKGL